MRIKKIEWEPVVDNGGDFYLSDPSKKLITRAYLPLDCVAVIWQYPECYMWKIKYRELSLNAMEADVSESIEEAKAACQVSWEKMVMEAIEPEDGCEHCREGKAIYDDKGLVLILDATTLDVEYPQEYGGPCYDSVDIDYCPICGRNL